MPVRLWPAGPIATTPSGPIQPSDTKPRRSLPPNSPQWAISFAHTNRCADRPLLRRRNRAKFKKGLWSQPDEHPGSQHEDYALYKKYELTRAGFPAEQLLIATLLDLNRASHAVLVVRTGANDLVLDNLTNKIVPWHKTGYTFLRMQDPRKPKRWVSVMAGGIFLM